MTKEEFKAKWFAGSGTSEDELLKLGIVCEAVPCDCGEPYCSEWRMAARPCSPVNHINIKMEMLQPKDRRRGDAMKIEFAREYVK